MAMVLCNGPHRKAGANWRPSILVGREQGWQTFMGTHIDGKGRRVYLWSAPDVSTTSFLPSFAGLAGRIRG
jgi:hypothetical protein